MKILFALLLVLSFFSPMAFAFGPKPPENTPAPPTPPAPPTKDELNQILEKAVFTNDLAKTRETLALGADANGITKNAPIGISFLTLAALKSDDSIVSTLLLAGADINGTNDHHPLAAAHTRPALVFSLLGKGANPNLLESINANFKVPVANFLLSTASCDLLSLTMIDKLLAAGANFDFKSSLEENGLFHIGCGEAITNFGTKANLYATIMDRLLGLGLNINAINKSGDTPYLVLATQYRVDPQGTAKMEYLFQKGADVHAKNSKGRNALMITSTYKNYPLFDYYLNSKRFDLNTQDVEGNTALMLATTFGDIRNTVVLANAGACLNVINAFGKTALGIALDNKHLELADVLRVYLKETPSPDCKKFDLE
jgi:ankyrin repeat protein